MDPNKTANPLEITLTFAFFAGTMNIIDEYGC
jgi:hypothetical protein